MSAPPGFVDDVLKQQAAQSPPPIIIFDAERDFGTKVSLLIRMHFCRCSNRSVLDIGDDGRLAATASIGVRRDEVLAYESVETVSTTLEIKAKEMIDEMVDLFSLQDADASVGVRHGEGHREPNWLE